MMDGPVFGRFATVFGTVRQQIAQKTVGRCVEVIKDYRQPKSGKVNGFSLNKLANLNGGGYICCIVY